MNIPKQLKIIGFDWKIKEDRNVAHEGAIHGSTHSYSQTIFLDPDNTKQKQEQTFLHEVIHAIWWQTALGKRFPESKMEEEIISALSQGLYQVLTDNKLLK